MYHQFKQLGDLDITTQPWKLVPTCHYMMGGVRVDADTEATCVPGPLCCRRGGGGFAWLESTGRQLPQRLAVFGQRAGAAAAEYARRS